MGTIFGNMELLGSFRAVDTLKIWSKSSPRHEHDAVHQNSPQRRTQRVEKPHGTDKTEK